MTVMCVHCKVEVKAKTARLKSRCGWVCPRCNGHTGEHNVKQYETTRNVKRPVVRRPSKSERQEMATVKLTPDIEAYGGATNCMKTTIHHPPRS